MAPNQNTKDGGTDLHSVRKRGVDSLLQELKENGHAAVSSATMKEWLNADLIPRGTNVDELLPQFQLLWTEPPPQCSEEALETIYQHKKVFHSTYQLGQEGQLPTRLTENIVTDEQGILRQKYIVHEKTSTLGEATSYYIRSYPALPFKWDDDLLVRATQQLFADVFTESHQRWMGVQEPAGNTVFQFCYRTVMRRLAGDPGPEGVHVDGGTAAMILVVRRENIKPLTGGTRIWSMQQKTGKPTSEDIESSKVLRTWKPKQEFDALFFLDERVMHEALRGELLDTVEGGLRDMFIMDIRRKDRAWHGIVPVVKGE